MNTMANNSEAVKEVKPCPCHRQPTVLQPDGGSDWQVICRICGRRGPTAGSRGLQ